RAERIGDPLKDLRGRYGDAHRGARAETTKRVRGGEPFGRRRVLHPCLRVRRGHRPRPVTRRGALGRGAVRGTLLLGVTGLPLLVGGRAVPVGIEARESLGERAAGDLVGRQGAVLVDVEFGEALAAAVRAAFALELGVGRLEFDQRDRAAAVGVDAIEVLREPLAFDFRAGDHAVWVGVEGRELGLRRGPGTTWAATLRVLATFGVRRQTGTPLTLRGRGPSTLLALRGRSASTVLALRGRSASTLLALRGRSGGRRDTGEQERGGESEEHQRFHRSFLFFRVLATHRVRPHCACRLVSTHGTLQTPYEVHTRFAAVARRLRSVDVRGFRRPPAASRPASRGFTPGLPRPGAWPRAGVRLRRPATARGTLETDLLLFLFGGSFGRFGFGRCGGFELGDAGFETRELGVVLVGGRRCDFLAFVLLRFGFHLGVELLDARHVLTGAHLIGELGHRARFLDAAGSEAGGDEQRGEGGSEATVGVLHRASVTER